MSEGMPQPKGQRVLFIGIEFVDPNFSGNGVYSRTIVKSLLSLNKVDVHVLCGRPEQDKNENVTLSSHDLGKFVVAFAPFEFQNCSPWMVRYCTKIVKSLEESVEYIKNHFVDVN